MEKVDEVTQRADQGTVRKNALPVHLVRSTISVPSNQSQAGNIVCSFVDFRPRQTNPEAKIRAPLYERLSVLLSRANAWLTDNPTWKVISCETVRSDVRYANGQWRPLPVYSTVSTFISSQTRNGTTDYNRSLRLWICSKTPADDPAPQQIGYMSVLPACVKKGGLLIPEFESFDETVRKFNVMIAQQPIPGRVINMETRNTVAESSKLDPKAGIWRECKTGHFVNYIRIFFEIRRGTVTSIGIAEFVPDQIENAKKRNRKRFESFSATMAKVNAWFAQQPPNLNIVNMQSIDYRKHGKLIFSDKKNSSYLRYTTTLRVIRVYWTQGTHISNPHLSQCPLELSHGTFVPAQLTSDGLCSFDRYESQVETMKRALAWCNATGAKVFSMETVECLRDC